MEITNKYNLPESLVRIVKKTSYAPKPKRYGITTLLKGNTEIILSRRYWNELSEDVSDDMWALFGTMFHAYIEQHDNTGYSEYKFVVPVSESYVVGVIDLLDKKNGVIRDYKTTTCWKIVFQDYEDYRNQLLGYAWGIWKKTKGKTLILKGQIIAFLRDWSKTKLLQSRGGNYPSKNIVTIDFDFTEQDIIDYDKFVLEKVKSLEKQKYWHTNELIECSEKEKWTTPTTYAIIKNDNKTASKVCESESEANKVIETFMLNDTKSQYHIVERIGVDKKCVDYCRVRGICPFRVGVVSDEN